MTSPTILGISAFYHDSAAALVSGAEIIAAAQEERFSRKKHDPRFPKSAINYCLEEGGIMPSELDAIIFYDNPVLTLDRIVKNCSMAGPAAFEQFEKGCRSTLGLKFWVKDFVTQTIGSAGKLENVLYAEHHIAHAASAFYPSPFDRAAIITVDGVGEWASTTIGLGSESSVELIEEIDYPHSLGLLYSAFTAYTGFKVNSGEYKLMGLAPYGTPSYYDLIMRELIDVREDGSYRLNTEYFGYLTGGMMTNEKFHSLFGGAPRQPESRISRREMDLAASIQKVTEEVMLRLCRHTRALTGLPNLTMAGGVALNCVANGKILRERIFEKIWIQPAAGDAGGSLGGALWAAHSRFGVKRKAVSPRKDHQKGSYLGPAFGSAEVRAFLERRGYPFVHVPDRETRSRIVAEAIAGGKIVGFFSGRMEFGPRALGARSILGDPRNKDTQAQMNLKIKYRESFRPFAPAVLSEDSGEYFDLESESPYMLLVAPVREERRTTIAGPLFDEGEEDMLKVINRPRSDIPSVTHVDYSARIQTVHREEHPEFYSLIQAFKRLTGYGLVVNTSFNVRGEPIVCSPMDAYLCFMRTEIDLLVLEDFLVWKSAQPAFEEKEDWRKTYELD